jgi:hypothetical protein
MLNFMGSVLTCALSKGFQRCECVIGTRHRQANRKDKFELYFSLYFSRSQHCPFATFIIKINLRPKTHKGTNLMLAPRDGNRRNY